MTAQLLDADDILSRNEQWMKLEEEWKSIDLETEEDDVPAKVTLYSYSTWDLRRPTFDSSLVIKNVKRTLGRTMSKRSDKSELDYTKFIQNLKREPSSKHLPQASQFYIINGEMISAVSVEKICHNIDEIFKSLDTLCSATSTIRSEKQHPKIPEIVQCSISTDGLSFDDTVINKDGKISNCNSDINNENQDNSDVVDEYLDECIDEAFDRLNASLTHLSIEESFCEKSIRESSVTSLVKKFSSFLTSPAIKCSRKRQRRCCEKFKDLTEFWNSRPFDGNK